METTGMLSFLHRRAVSKFPCWIFALGSRSKGSGSLSKRPRSTLLLGLLHVSWVPSAGGGSSSGRANAFPARRLGRLGPCPLGSRALCEPGSSQGWHAAVADLPPHAGSASRHRCAWRQATRRFASAPNLSLCSPVPAPRLAAEDLEEGLAEVGVEGCVDDGVESAVHVAKPGAGTVKPWGHVAGRAVGIENVNQEEGQPADYECPWV